MEDNARPDEMMVFKSEMPETPTSVDKDAVTEGETASGGAALEKAARADKLNCSPNDPTQSESDEMNESVEEGEIIRIGLGTKKTKKILRGEFYWKNKLGLFHCKKCKKKFRSVAGVTFHYDAEHFHIKYQCGICKEAVFKHLPSLINHKRKCRKVEKTFLCQLCGERFSLKRRLLAHQTQAHKIERGTASKANKKGIGPGGKNRKAKKILNGKFYRKEDGLYQCTACERKYATDTGVLNHYDTVHLQKRYKCDICEEAVYKFYASLWRHQKTCPGSANKHFSCQLCKKPGE